MLLSLVQQKKDSRGFSLVEMMVSVSLFMIVMIIAIGGLMTLVYSGSIVESSNSVSANLSLALDSMTRNIRTGYSYYCSSSIPSSGALPSGTLNCTSGATGIVFTNSRTGVRTAFRFNNTATTDGHIEQRVSGSSWIRITSEDIDVNAMTFYVTGSSSGDTVQPTVRFLVNALSKEGDEAVPFYMQTLVTSRLLDV